MRNVCEKDVGELNGSSIASMSMKPHIPAAGEDAQPPQQLEVYLPGEPTPRTMKNLKKYEDTSDDNNSCTYGPILDTMSTSMSTSIPNNAAAARTIITSHSSGHIVAWETQGTGTGTVLYRAETMPAAICMWKECIVCITDEASLAAIPLPSSSIRPAKDVDGSKKVTQTLQQQGGEDDVSSINPFEEEEEDGTAQPTGGEEQSGTHHRHQFVDDEAAEDSDDGASFSNLKKEEEVDASKDEEGTAALISNSNVNDDDDLASNNPFQGNDNDNGEEEEEEVNSVSAPPAAIMMTSAAVTAELDHMSMPGSTPAVRTNATAAATATDTNDENTTQILCWNYHGCITSRTTVIRQTDDDDDDDVMTTQNIDIAFNNNLVNKPVRFNNLAAKDQYTLASLGERGSVYAGDDSNVIYYHSNINGNAVNWTHKLPDGEHALHLAVGLFGAAVFTDNGYLRLFSPSGLQFHLRVADVSTMVARGNYLFLIDSRRNYSLYSVTVDKLEKMTSGVFYQKTNFAWIGMTDTCSPCVLMDDVICVLYGGSGRSANDSNDGSVCDDYAWVPMLDVGAVVEGKSYTKFWPVAVHGDQVIGVPLHHRDHPDPVRRPVTSALSLKMPLCKNSSAAEEIHLRATCAMQAKLATTDDYEAEYAHLAEELDKVTLKLLHSALESSNQYHALDICQRLRTEKGLDVAKPLCEQFGFSKLCRAVENLRDELFPEEDDDDDGLIDEHTTRTSSSKVSLTPDGSVYEGLGRGPIKRSRADDGSVGDNSTVLTMQEMLEDEVHQPSKIRKGPTNPFAKKHLSSPVKKSSRPALLLSPAGTSKSTPKLSRLSTFSARSRENVKKNKHFI